MSRKGNRLDSIKDTRTFTRTNKRTVTRTSTRTIGRSATTYNYTLQLTILATPYNYNNKDMY